MVSKYIAHYLGSDMRGQSMQSHLKEVANLAKAFSCKIGLPSLGELEGLLHDIGKYSKHFQDYIRSAKGQLDPDNDPVDADELKGKIDHSTAGAQIAWEALKDDNPMSRLVAQAIALCVASHHSALIDCLTPEGEDKFSVRMAKKRDKTYLDEVQQVADKEIMGKAAALLHSPQCLDELKKQLERLFCGEKSREVREFYVGLLIRFLFSALIDADRLSASGRTEKTGVQIAKGPPWDLLIKRLERHISRIKKSNWVDEIRSKVSLACREFATREKGLYKLTVPTGGAKTISSLRFGLYHAARHQMERIIYVLPYTTIIDQNAAVARSALEKARDGHSNLIVLEHHTNLTPEKETCQSRLMAENWDAMVIFTTTVQFLETLFASSTRGVRKMHNLANAVIIFDEIQTLPIKTVHLFNNAINFLVKQCGSTVVFCTATQPLLHAVDARKGAARLADEPEMAPCPNELFKALRRVEVLDKRKIGGWAEIEIAQCICDEARESGSALAIVNTKAAARALYNLCRQELASVFHLSTYMCPAHRMKIIDRIKIRLKHTDPLVCVSTQLIEAGVDIDFGSVVRYLAGLDSIGQAAGRCNRNGRRPSGKVLVINPSHESLTMLPEIEIGRMRAERVLDEYREDPGAFDHNLLSPNAMQRFYEYYFFNRAESMAYPVSSKEIGHNDELLNLLSANTLSVEAFKRTNKCAPNLSLRQSFKSAGNVFRVIEAPTEGIVVPFGKDGKRIIAALCAVATPDETRSLLRQAQHYSISLYPHEVHALVSSGCVYETQIGSGIFYLDERYYSMDMGVVFNNPKGRVPRACPWVNE